MMAAMNVEAAVRLTFRRALSVDNRAMSPTTILAALPTSLWNNVECWMKSLMKPQKKRMGAM